MAFDDTATVSGSVVSIENGADDVPTKSLVVTIPPTLTGKSEVVCTQTGKNLFGLTPYLATAYNTPSFSDCMFVKGGSYTFSFDKISDGITDATLWRYCVTIYDTEGNLVTDWTVSAALPYRAALYSYVNGANSSNKYITFNLQDDCYIFIRFWSGDCTSSMNMISPMLELGSTASTFEPYSGATHTADLGRTIYGGTADIVKGEGKDGFSSISISETTWTYDSENSRFISANLSGMKNTAIRTLHVMAYGYETIDDARPIGNVPDQAIYNANYERRVIIHDSNYTNVTDFLSAKGNISIIYPLATPTDFTFDGQEINTRLGYNAFWSEQGNIELTYYKSGYGYTSVTVNKTGKNVWDEEWELGIWNSSGAKQASNNAIRSKNYIPVVSGAEYYIYSDFTVYSSGIVFRLLDKEKSFVRTVTVNSSSKKKITMDSNVKYIVWCSATADGVTTYSNNISINYPSTDTSYHAYSGVTKTAKLHKVIYGGKADVIRGTCEPKNPLKLYLARTSHQGINFSLTDEGLLHMEGTNTSATSSAFSGGNYSTYDACPWKFPAGTYTASSLITADNDKVGSVNFLIRTKTNNVNYSYALKDAPKTFTINDDFGAWFWASVLKTETVNCDVGVQLENGSTASDFAPHFDPFTFPPISISTDEGENTLFSNEGTSAITYRKETE